MLHAESSRTAQKTTCTRTLLLECACFKCLCQSGTKSSPSNQTLANLAVPLQDPKSKRQNLQRKIFKLWMGYNLYRVDCISELGQRHTAGQSDVAPSIAPLSSSIGDRNQICCSLKAIVVTGMWHILPFVLLHPSRCQYTHYSHQVPLGWGAWTSAEGVASIEGTLEDAKGGSTLGGVIVA